MAQGVPANPPLHLLRAPPHDERRAARREGETVNCGNDPNAKLTERDREWMTWFAAWLEWSLAPEGKPEPRDPNGETRREYGKKEEG